MTMVAAFKFDDFVSADFVPTVKARIRRNTPMQASVPELTNRTISILGTASITFCANTFSNSRGGAKASTFF